MKIEKQNTKLYLDFGRPELITPSRRSSSSSSSSSSAVSWLPLAAAPLVEVDDEPEEDRPSACGRGR